jgi:hypothetical protein
MSFDPPAMPPPPPPVEPAAPPAPFAKGDWHADRIIGMVAAGAIVIGAFLPWATVTVLFATISKDGIDGDGTITAVLGLVIAGLFLANTRAAYVLAMILSAVVLAVFAVDYVDVQELVEEAEDTEAAMASVGIGLYLTGLAALVTLGTALRCRRHLSST